MALIRYHAQSNWMNPFQEMVKMKRDMERLFSSFTAGGAASSFNLASGVFPALNVSEKEDCLYMEAELPGMKAEDLDISVMKNTITLKGERKPDGAGNGSYHRRERQAGTFHKALTLPYEIDPDKVEAHFEDGVLRLTLPKAEHAKPKRIQIAA